jgi:hypothetical protein
MKPHHTRTGTLCLIGVCIGVACCLLFLLVPSTMLPERLLQRGVHAIFFPKHEQAGGTDATSYEMLRFRDDAQAMPFVVALTEESVQDFDANPPSPSDVAVLLDCMREGGVERVVITSPLAWHDADPFALDALEMVSAGYSRCVTSAVVTRSAQGETIPAAMLRASVPLQKIRGNVRTLPVVNRIAVPQTFLGRENTWAGFSLIESESHSDGITPLLAVWGDRVVFSASLLAALQRENIETVELEIEVGKAIQARRSGQWWRIDEFGRHAWPQLPSRPPALSAAALLRPEASVRETLRTHHPPLYFSPVIRSDWSEVQNLHAAPRIAERVIWQSPQIATAVPLTALLSWLLVWLHTRSRARLVVAGSCFVMTWALLLWAMHCWINLTPSVAAVLVTIGMRRILSAKTTTSLAEETVAPHAAKKKHTNEVKKETPLSDALLDSPPHSESGDKSSCDHP